MSSEGSPSPGCRQPEQPAGSSQRKSSPFLFLAPAALVLVFAVAIPSTWPNLRVSLLSSFYSRCLLSPGLLCRVLRQLPLVPHQRDPSAAGIPKSVSPRPPCVLWMAPFVSGGGYSSEAWSYVTAIEGSMREEEDPPIRLAIEQHGDLENLEFWEGLPEGDRELAIRLHGTQCRLAETVVVCHSEPGAWYPPLFETLPCPPTGYTAPLAVVGRTMFETDRLNPEHARRCNRMDAVWVPTDFHVATFVASGVDPSKVVKVVQPVDVGFFDPSKYEPLALSAGTPVLGSRLGASNPGSGVKVFVFLSIFKWELRKGWDVLLTSYLREFTAADGVSLYLLTNPYHTDKDFGNKISEFVEDAKLGEPDGGWAPVFVMDSHIAQVDLPRLYKAADAFVLPSRGEGWGRPVVEAMAMELPVIVTNWSGPTEYLTEENGYPLPVDRMSKVPDGPFKGHLWAEPSVEQLRALMRKVISHPEEAKRRAARAREDMVRRFSPPVVARVVIDQILNISSSHQ